MEKNSKDKFNSGLKSWLIFKMVEGFKYSVKISHTKTTAVSVLKSTKPGSNVRSWLIRFDNPHKNVPFAHINLRHKFTGIKDPHLKLPPGALTVAQGGAYIGKALDFLCYITLVVDGIQLGQAIYKDHKEGTIENTAECAVDKTGQYVGGIVGGLVGKTIGSFLLPGIGPLVGAFAVGYLGVSYGRSYGTSYFQNYWSERKLNKEKEKAEMELIKFRMLYFSRLHVNPFCD